MSIWNVSCMKWNVVKVCPRGLQRYQDVINYQGWDLSFCLGRSVGQSVGQFVFHGSESKLTLTQGSWGDQEAIVWTSEERDGTNGSSTVRMSHHRHGLAAPDTLPDFHFIVMNSVILWDHHESLGLLLPCAIPLVLTTLSQPRSPCSQLPATEAAWPHSLSSLPMPLLILPFFFWKSHRLEYFTTRALHLCRSCPGTGVVNNKNALGVSCCWCPSP